VQINYAISFQQKIPDFAKKKELMKDIAEKLYNDIRRNLRESRTPEGGPIAALRPSTVKKKIEAGYSHPNTPLMASKILYNAIKYKATASYGAVWIIGRGKPPRDKLALDHEKIGFNWKTKTKRAFFGMSSKTRIWIRFRIQRWFKQKINNPVLYKTSIWRS